MSFIKLNVAVCLWVGAWMSCDAQIEPPVVSVVEPTWDSMAENYKVPEWFVDGKFGVWTHWGIPSALDEDRPRDGSWYGSRMYGGTQQLSKTLSAWHIEHYGPLDEVGYEKLIPLFKAEKWNPEALVKYFRECGAWFIMPVATHHDNFDMYDSSNPWNSVKMGPHRDTLNEWKTAAAKYGMKFGVSTHLYWSPRFYAAARKYQKPGTPEWQFFQMDYDPVNYASQDSWNQHWYDRCWEIIEKYDPDMFNNDCPFPSETAGKGLGVKLFSSYINQDLKQNKGDQTVVFSCKSSKLSRKAFTYNLERGASDKIQPEPWMWATDLSGGWFYQKVVSNKMRVPVMIGNAVDAISKNGVVMMNVALKGNGTIPEKQAVYLDAFGAFLKTCGEGIYKTRPWKIYGEGPTQIKDGRQGENKLDYTPADIRFTTKDGKLYAFVLAHPKKDIVIKSLATGGLLDQEIDEVMLLGSDEKIKWTRTRSGLTLQLPGTLPDQPVVGFKLTLK